MSTEVYTLQTLRIKIVWPFLRSNPIDWYDFLHTWKISLTNHKPNTIFFTSEGNHIGFYCHFKSLVAVNTNTALPWRNFWNVKRRIQDTKKSSKSECKMTKYQEPKQNKHNNRLCEGKPCKWSSQNSDGGLKSLLTSNERTFPVNWPCLSSFLTFFPSIKPLIDIESIKGKLGKTSTLIHSFSYGLLQFDSTNFVEWGLILLHGM